MRKQFSAVKMVGKLLLCVVILVSMFSATTLVASAASTSKSNAEVLTGSDLKQANLSGGVSHWYKVTPESTQYYRFTFLNQSVEVRTGISIADSFLNMFLGKMSVTIYDQYSMKLAAGDIRCGYSGSVSLKLEKGATYYVKVTSTVAGNYRITTKTFADMGSDTWGGAEEMLSNGQLISSIDASGDNDWFKFVADGERSYYRFALENISGNGYMYFYLCEYVEGAGETPLRDVLDFSVSSGTTNSRDVQLKEGAVYYYRISGSVGGYMLNVSQTLDVAGSDFDGAYTIPTDKTVTTSFDGKGDVDVFKFKTGSKDAYYHFDFEALSDIDGYVHFYIYDVDGNDVTNHTTGYGYDWGRFDCKLSKDKTYYLYIDKTDGSMCNYTFSITTKQDRYPNSMKNALKVSIDTQIKSSFDGTGDVDWVKFTTGTKDAYYRFRLDALSDVDGYMRFYVCDADGNDVTSHTTGYNYDFASFDCKLTKNKTYYLKIWKDSSAVCNYTLFIKTQQDRYPNSMKNALKVSIDTQIKSSFDGTGDVDWVKFTTGTKDAYYRFRLDALSDVDGYMRFYVCDADGNDVTSHTTGYNYDFASFYYKLTKNKTYYLKIWKDSSAVCNYNLNITTVLDPEPNSRENALKLSLNTVKSSQLACEADVDWFKFTVDYDDDYRIRLFNETSGCIEAELYNSRESSVKWMTAYEDEDSVVSLSAGTYYLVIKRRYDTPKYYSVSVAECGSGHVEKAVYSTKAGIGKNGTKKTVCKYCGKTIKTEKVPAISTVKASWTNVSCNGSVRRPTITVTDVNGKKITSYSVKWSNSSSKTPGTYTATVTLNGAYSGTKKITYKLGLATPKVTSAGSSSGNKISWNKVPCATTYKVYVRSLSNGNWSSWKALKTTSSTSYTHTSATKGKYYRYAVVAYKGDYKSELASGNTTVYLATPSSVKATGNTSGNKVTWKKVTGAKEYQVYARRYSNGKWGSWTRMTTTTKTSYTHSKAANGGYYEYKVRAKYNDSVGAFKSSSKVVRLAQPKVTAKKSGSSIKVTWNKVSGAKGYKVYRRYYNSSTKKWSSWVTVKTTTARSYTDKSTKKGVYYQYAAKAYNGTNSNSTYKACTKIKR